MEYLRKITSGVKFPRALVFGPSGNLFVADQDKITVYPPNASKPKRQITQGINRHNCSLPIAQADFT